MNQKDQDKQLEFYQHYYKKPKKYDFTTWAGIKLFAYDKKTGEIFGRTGSSWCKCYGFCIKLLFFISIYFIYIVVVEQ